MYIEGLTFVIPSTPARCRRTARRAATGRIRSRGAGGGSETARHAATGEAACNGARGAARRRRAGPEPFELGELAIGYDQRRVTVAGRAVKLTPTEYEPLRLLSLEANRVVTYRTLLDQIWNQRAKGSWKVVRAFVKQLRAKLGDDAANPSLIFNVRGVGYRMPRPNPSGNRSTADRGKELYCGYENSRLDPRRHFRTCRATGLAGTAVPERSVRGRAR